MTENELRGLLLEKYYQRRKERLIGLSPSDFDGQLNAQDILTIAGQLADQALIHWRPDSHGGIGGGMGTITAAGIDVVEGKAAAPFGISLSREPGPAGPGAARVPPPPAGRPSVAAAIEALAHAIDQSGADGAQKRAATLLLRAFQQHPLVCTMAPGAVEPLSDRAPKAQFEPASETVDENH